MKSKFSTAGRTAAFSALAMLSACAGGQREPASPEPRGAMQGPSSGSPMATIDMVAMCGMYEKMVHARTPEERQANMGDWMKNMSPEMRSRHMEALQAECEGAPADRSPDQRK